MGDDEIAERDAAAARAAKDADRRKKKIIVRMEFEPLLSLHEPLSTLLEEPAQLFAGGKRGNKNKAKEQAALEDANANYRAKAKAVASWMTDVGLEDCLLQELATAIGEESEELRFGLDIIQSLVLICFRVPASRNLDDWESCRR